MQGVLETFSLTHKQVAIYILKTFKPPFKIIFTIYKQSVTKLTNPIFIELFQKTKLLQRNKFLY